MTINDTTSHKNKKEQKVTHERHKQMIWKLQY